MTDPSIPSISSFIARLTASGAAERANYQLFLSELCDALDLPRPDPRWTTRRTTPTSSRRPCRCRTARLAVSTCTAAAGSCLRPSRAATASTRRLLCRSWSSNSAGTAERHCHSRHCGLGHGHGARPAAGAELRPYPARGRGSRWRPPFLLVVDVGQSIALYSEFSRSGGTYIPFPDPASYRLPSPTCWTTKNASCCVRSGSTRWAWTRRGAARTCTRDIADRLARLARSLEGAHPAEDVAHFLMRCLFTMFAEDVGLFPNRAFTQLLADSRLNVASFPPWPRSCGARWPTAASRWRCACPCRISTAGCSRTRPRCR